MESPKTNVRVLRSRVVERESKDGVSTPSKLGTPSKRGTPSKVAGDASSITTRTRRRLSTKLENEITADKLEPLVVTTRLPELRTPSKRGNRNVSESDKSPEGNITTRNTRKDFKKEETSPSGTKKGNLSVSPHQNKKVSLEDGSSPVADKSPPGADKSSPVADKPKGDLSPIIENGESSTPPQSSKVLFRSQSSPKLDNKVKGDLPPILEGREDSDDSIIENSFQLELSISDKTRNEVKNSAPISPSIEKSPSKSNKEESIQPSSPESLAHSSPAKSVSDVGHLAPQQSENLDQNNLSEVECESIVQEEKKSNDSGDQKEGETTESVEQQKVSIESVDQEETIESVEQGEESSESDDVHKITSKMVNQTEEQNKTADQEEESVDQEEPISPNQVEKTFIEDESDKSINQEKASSEIPILQQECSEPVDQGEECIEHLETVENESSETIFIEKESNKSVDKVSESQNECNTADSTLNSMVTTKNSSIIESSPSKKCASNSENDAHLLDGIVKTVEDNIPLKGDNSMNISLEDKSKSNNVSFQLIENFQDSSAVNTLHDGKDDNDIRISSQHVLDQWECKKKSESSPLKVSQSPKPPPSMLSSPRKHSSPREISAVTSPMCQRLPDEEQSPSKASEISPPEKLVCTKDTDKKISDNDSDSDDSDLPEEIPSKHISRNKSPCSTNHIVIKSTPSPSKVLKVIKPVQSEKLYKMKNLIESTYEMQPISKAFKAQNESHQETSEARADLDKLTISRKELSLIMKEAIDNALVGLKKDVLEMRKKLSDLITLRRKEEEEKAKHFKEETMNEICLVLKRNKELVVEQLLAKQAAQIFSDCDSPSKKKKSPKKNKESTKEKADNSGSESCSTLPSTHQPKLKKRKMMEIAEEEMEDIKNIEEEIDDNPTTNVEVKKKRKRKNKTAAVETTEETATEPTHYVDVEPIEEGNNCQDDLQSELKRKKKRTRRNKNKDKETPFVESTEVNSSDVLENLPKKSKKEHPSAFSQEDCMNVESVDHQMINEEKKEKKHKKKNAEQMNEASSENAFLFDLDQDELEPSNEGEKKKKKKHVDLQHSPDDSALTRLDSNEFSQQSLNEVKKKKKKKHVDQIVQHLSPNLTSPDQNSVRSQLLKIKKQKLKKNLKPKSNFNISQQHLKSYIDEFCDFKPKDKVKVNAFEDGINEVLKSKDTNKLKRKKKNKGSVNNSFEMESRTKDAKHSKKEVKDLSHKLTPSTNLDVTNFWL